MRSHRWPAALAIGFTAAAVSMALQQWIRAAWQVRSLPERVMESLLVFIPLDLFERGLQRFGGSAKDIALAGTFVGMFILLGVIGTLAVHARVHAWLMLVLGCGLWLTTMLIVMPLTGAGLFATALLVPPLLTDAAFGLVFLGYGAVLALGSGLLAQRTGHADAYASAATASNRRALLAAVAGLIGAAAAYGLARAAAGSSGGTFQSSLPLASAPTAVPSAVTTPTSTALTPAPAAGAPIATSTVVATPTPVAGYPTPAPARALARDQEGSLTAAGRPPGTLAPPITSNRDFYVVTKNAVADPVLDANTWRLIIDGEVNQPVQLDYRTLRALPAVELTKTLECISNLTAGCTMASFGCDLISTAVWRGVRLTDLLNLAGGLKTTAVDVAFLSTDEFSAGLPVDAVLDPNTLVVYEMNGDVLPREHGYPARLLVPGRYGMKNPKWLAGIRALDQPYSDWYQQRGWTPDGFVKTMSRIDVPADAAAVPSGPLQVAGIAYAGARGIRLVEVSSDGGTSWSPASLLDSPTNPDVMVRWQATVQMAGQPLTLVVRATDGTGVVQPEDFGLPAPDGGWGQDSIQVQPA